MAIVVSMVMQTCAKGMGQLKPISIFGTELDELFSGVVKHLKLLNKELLHVCSSYVWNVGVR